MGDGVRGRRVPQAPDGKGSGLSLGQDPPLLSSKHRELHLLMALSKMPRLKEHKSHCTMCARRTVHHLQARAETQATLSPPLPRTTHLGRLGPTGP